MPYQDDVFISYAHLDNQPLTEGSQGWVSEFHEALGKRLAEVWGQAPRIWRDPKLQGNDVFGDELDQRYRQAAVLVSVITPRYVASDWCRRELDGFWQAAGATGGAVVEGHKARVFKVVKTPVRPDALPPPVQPLLGYEFYRLQPGNGRPLEFNRVYGPDAERDFWVRLNDLAYDLTELLQALASPAPAAGPTRPVAYLASVTSELQAQRDALRRELLRQRYGVRPEAELPLRAADAEHQVAAALQGCDLSIHLVGAGHGVVPEGGTESLPALEARLAAARAREGGLRRLVWLAPGSDPGDPRQQAFVAGLRDDPVPGAGSDLLETPIEELTALALARLADAARPPPAQPARSVAGQAAPSGPARIYLVCDQGDLDAVRPLRQHLFDAGHDALLPAFEGDEAQQRADHETQLLDADAVLLYYGAGGELWLRQKLTELRRLPALGRTQALRAVAVCIAPPATPAKQQLMTREAMTLAMPDGFDAAALAPFLLALQHPPPVSG